MEVEQLTIPREKAEQELQGFKDLIKTHRKTVLQEVHRDLHRVYGHIQKGGTAIDVHASFKKARLNVEGDPRLAICRADGKTCYLVKHKDGSTVYSAFEFSRSWEAYVNDYQGRKSYGDIALPPETFDFPKNGYGKIKQQFVQTLTPIIPASILAPIKHSLKNYHVVWEVEEWKPVPPRDPILVKMVNPSVALVLATWNLTELERAIIKGRL